jgi:hypothetical protein
VSNISRFVLPVVVLTVALVVAAEELPKLLGPAATIFGMAVIARLVWFYTQRW